MVGLVQAKAALVTGAGNGIERAAALALGREGARVVVADLALENAQSTAAAIIAAGGQATAIAGDVSKAHLVRSWVAEVVDTFGRIDCAFNKCWYRGTRSGGGSKLLAEWPEEGFDRMTEVNLKSVCMRDEITAMLADGLGGSIVNTSSIAGIVAHRNSAGYGAAKNGVIGLTKAAAVEYADQNIRVNALAPGYVETNMSRPLLAQSGTSLFDTIPAKRAGTPEEIAELVVWLRSDQSSYVTGQTIAADGGVVA